MHGQKLKATTNWYIKAKNKINKIKIKLQYLKEVEETWVACIFGSTYTAFKHRPYVTFGTGMCALKNPSTNRHYEENILTLKLKYNKKNVVYLIFFFFFVLTTR